MCFQTPEIIVLHSFSCYVVNIQPILFVDEDWLSTKTISVDVEALIRECTVKVKDMINLFFLMRCFRTNHRIIE